MNRIVYENHVFEHNDIKRGNIYKARSLSCSVLEIDTLSVDVTSADASLKDFTKYTPLYYYFNGAQVGVFYLENIKRIAVDLYTISAVSMIGVLDVTNHFGGIYTDAFAGDIIREICAGVPVFIKSNMEKVMLSGYLPIASRRNNLSQVLLAMGAFLKVDNNGVLRVEPLWPGVVGTFTEDDAFMEGDVKYSTPAKSAVITEHQYLRGVDRVSLFEGTTEDGEVITFSSPVHSLTASGFRILESGANYARVSAGTGEITGINYIHNTKDVVAGDLSSDETTVRVSGATLVSAANARAVAERVLSFANKSEQAIGDVVYMGQEPGDVITAPNAYFETQDSCIQSLDINISAVLRAKQTSLVGYIPPEPDHIPADTPAISAFLTSDGNVFRGKNNKEILV